MKIQVITNLFPLPWEPNRATFNRQQFKLLSNYCEVRLILIVSWLERLRNQLHIVSAGEEGIKIQYLWYFYVPKFLRWSYPFTLFLSLLFKLPTVLRYRPDCLLLSWAYPDAVAGMALARLLRVPAVIKVHGSDINMHAMHGSRAKQIKWAMNRAIGVVTVSRDLADKVKALGVDEEKIRVIYNGVNHDKFKPADRLEERSRLGLSGAGKTILFVGNLKPAKGCVDLLEAFLKLAESDSTFNDTELCFIGAGPAMARMESLVRDSNREDRVRLLGAMNHSEIVHWINASNLVSLPSHNEGVPNVLLEAMACGIPVVATRVGGIPEIVSDKNGILVEPGSREKLQQALKDCLQRDWDRTEIVNSVKRYNWNDNVQQMHELLQSSLHDVANY